jgi:choline dehydrogenase-like flavoprotein
MSESKSNNVITAPPERLRVEIAVIGSGPGGAITAYLLAEAGRDVLLIEEGPFLPLESCSPFSQQEMVQKYRNGGLTVALGRTKIVYVEGRCVGGGSEINSGLYHRTPPETLDRWRLEFGVEALSEADMGPHFEACEQDMAVSYHPGPLPEASLKLHEGSQRLGWKSMEVPRWFRYNENDGGKAAGGTRQSMTKTFVPRALAAGCRLLPNTRVGLLKPRADGWALDTEHILSTGQKRQVEINAGTVFVCGGAIQTPALLRRSGITQGIGDSLKLQAMVKVIARFREEVNFANMGVPVHQVKEFAPRFSLGCSVSTPAHLAIGMADYPRYSREVDMDWQKMAAYYAMIQGGQGTVRPISFYRDPLVRYSLCDTDLRCLSDGLRELCRALLAAGAEALFPSITGYPRLAGETDLSRIPRPLLPAQTHLTSVHLTSSCPMGENRQRCATDSFGKVHGHKNLYIADASLLCDAPGVNPQGTIMALVRRNTMKFLGTL